MTVTAHQVAPALDHTLDAIALNAAQAHLLFNATPEIDSLGELIMVAPIDAATKAALINVIRQIVALNDDEAGCSRKVAGALDEVLTLARRSERAHTTITETLGVKSLAKALRPLLGDAAKAEPGSFARLLAERQILDITRKVTRRQVEAGSLAIQLGPNRHALLVEIFNAGQVSA